MRALSVSLMWSARHSEFETPEVMFTCSYMEKDHLDVLFVWRAFF